MTSRTVDSVKPETSLHYWLSLVQELYNACTTSILSSCTETASTRACASVLRLMRGGVKVFPITALNSRKPGSPQGSIQRCSLALVLLGDKQSRETWRWIWGSRICFCVSQAAGRTRSMPAAIMCYVLVLYWANSSSQS